MVNFFLEVQKLRPRKNKLLKINYEIGTWTFVWPQQHYVKLMLEAQSQTIRD